MAKRKLGTCEACGASLWAGNTTGFCIQHKSRLQRNPDGERMRRGLYREDPPTLRHPQMAPESEGAAEPEIEVDTALLDLVRITRKAPVPFEELCDRLNVAPRRLRELLEEAKEQSLAVAVEGDRVGIPKAIEHVQESAISPVIGDRQKVAHITDTHLGSTYCLREYLKDFIHYAYAQGVREILHTGDIVDGMYSHAAPFELSHHGLEAQVQDLFETLPALPGLTYHAICGNHDWTFSHVTGVDVPQFIGSYFRAHGRDDWFAYGNRGAHLRVKGAVFHLWHPSGGVPYALTYGLQKKCEGYSPGFKPHFLLAGHWHTHVVADIRGIYCVAGGTFQGGESAFAKSLKSGAPAIGGSILSWEQTEEGTVRNFVHERRRYFEKETAQQVQVAAEVEAEALLQGKKGLM